MDINILVCLIQYLFLQEQFRGNCQLRHVKFETCKQIIKLARGKSYANSEKVIKYRDHCKGWKVSKYKQHEVAQSYKKFSLAVVTCRYITKIDVYTSRTLSLSLSRFMVRLMMQTFYYLPLCQLWRKILVLLKAWKNV